MTATTDGSAADCIFLRLLSADDKGTALLQAVSSLRAGQADGRLIHEVDPAAFAQVPGSPFAYWVSDRIRRLFTELPPFEGEGRTVRVGLQTSDDFRFVRAWWEVPAERVLDAANGPDWREDLPVFQARCRRRTFEGKRWAPFAKGGEYSPYYADIHLVVNWERAGEEIRGFDSAVVRNEEYYFRPGLTWPLRAARFSPATLPAGSIPSVRGYGAYGQPDQLLPMLGVCNSAIFDYLFKVCLGRFGFPEFVVGVLQKLPHPRLVGTAAYETTDAARQLAVLQRGWLGADETNRVFAGSPGAQTAEAGLRRRDPDLGTDGAACSAQHRIDRELLKAFGMSASDLDSTTGADDGVGEPEDQPNGNEAASDVGDSANTALRVSQLMSSGVGWVLGRFDARMAESSQVAGRPGDDPFDPLRSCSPAMLQTPDGMPARETPLGYPIRIAWSGILLDDPGLDGDRPHPEDIVRRVRESLEVLFPARADAMEQEACAILGYRSLRDYFRAPGGFFAEHLSRYSKSRRKAPIYWPLSTKSGSYTLWIYYHRLDGDLLFRAVNEFVNPKIREAEASLESRKTELDGAAGRAAGEVRRSFESLQDLRGELLEFRDELLRVANLPYRPNLDDGVLINAAPLWRLFRLPKWRGECEACWKELEAGAYEWAHLAYTIWPERVERVCGGDRSIALAHGLEEVYEGVRKAEGRAGRTRAAAPVAEAPPALPSLGGAPGRQPRARGGASALPRRGSGATGGASGEPARSRGVAEGAAALSAGAEQILAALRSAPGPLGRAALVGLAGIGEASWLSAIRQLKERGVVRQVGERRGAVYVANGARPPASP